MILSALVINYTYCINVERPYDLFRFCFQLVVLSCSEFAEVALRIIILEINRIESLIAKAIVKNLVYPVISQVFSPHDTLGTGGIYGTIRFCGNFTLNHEF